MHSGNHSDKKAFSAYTAALFLLLIAIDAWVAPIAQAQSILHPGTPWRATDGKLLEAHGAGVIKVGSTFYLIGEDHSNTNSFSGINCYSSPDLVTWTFVADILPPQASGDLTPNAVIQRPKVIYNAASHTYVMWLHVDNSDYSLNHTGVATSSTVCGAYHYRGSFQPAGNPSFDMGLFQDSNGAAYLLTTQNNVALRIEQLAPDYLSVAKIVATLPSMEGAAMAKAGNLYYIFCSHLSGWAPNDNEYATASAIDGTWSALQEFTPSGTDTFRSQDSWILPVTGASGTTYVYMGDRWVASDLAQSSYVWLPLHIAGTSVSMAWYNGWDLNISAGTWRPYNGAAPAVGDTPLVGQSDGLCLSGVRTEQGAQLEPVTCDGSPSQRWTATKQGGGYTLMNAATAMVATGDGEAIVPLTADGGAAQQWIFRSNGQGYFNIINVKSGLCMQARSAPHSTSARIEQQPCDGSASQNWRQ